MSNILRELNQKPIAYYPIYRQLTGSTTAGILLSQLMYWFSKKDTFHKTDADIMSETLLTKKELENAKKAIKNLDFISVDRKGIPAKTYYTIDWDLMETCLHQRGNTDSTKGGNCTTPKGETIYSKSFDTKTTTKTTSKNNPSLSPHEDFNLIELVAELKANLFGKQNEMQHELNTDSFDEFEQHRKEIKKPLTKLAAKKIIRILCRYPQEIQEQMIDNSIQNGWTGVFEPKKQFSGSFNNPFNNAVDRYFAGDTAIDAEVVQ